MSKKLLAALCLLLGAALIGRADLIAAGIATGMSVCIDVLIPSLFPFMALAGFVALSGLGSVVAWPLRPLTRLLRLPDSLGAVWLAGLVGGYPTGAATLSALVSQGHLSPRDASRLLLFCVNPGPAFVVVAVGARMFGSMQLGWLLLLAQVLSSLLLGAWVMRRGPRIAAAPILPTSLADALVGAVKSASAGMLSVCAYVLLFSALSALLAPVAGNGFRSALLTGFLEVTSGCAAAARLGTTAGCLLTAFLLSFSGLSVLCQVMALAHSAGLKTEGLFSSRLACGLLATLIFALLLRFFGPTLSVLSSDITPLAVVAPRRLLGAFCLGAMLLTTLGEPLREKL